MNQLPDVDKIESVVSIPDVSEFTEESFHVLLKYRSRNGERCELKLQWSDVIAAYILARSDLSFQDEEAGWMTPAVQKRLREVYNLRPNLG